jgi:Asp-tRNA(Asn)/Glu-tRNA(Gln) amidotransferase A subunit family amidase
MMRLLVVANHGIDSEAVCDALIERAAAGPVQVTLVASASVGDGPLCVPRTEYGEHVVRTHQREAAERMQRAVKRLRDAGVTVEGVVSGECDASGSARDVWDPARFDEIVVSCRPWLSCQRAVS